MGIIGNVASSVVTLGIGFGIGYWYANRRALARDADARARDAAAQHAHPISEPGLMVQPTSNPNPGLTPGNAPIVQPTSNPNPGLTPGNAPIVQPTHKTKEVDVYHVALTRIPSLSMTPAVNIVSSIPGQPGSSVIGLKGR